MHSDGKTTCSWCGADAPAEGSYLLTDIEGARRMVFCRLEHVVPWVMRAGARQRGEIEQLGEDELARARTTLGDRCSHCDRELAETPAALLLSRERAGQSVEDSFCEVEHLRAWASAGGRWARKAR